jgi:hypothetical protein
LPTAASSTDLRRDLSDLRALVAFRQAMVRDRSRQRLRQVFVGLGLLTLAAAVLPVFLPGAGTSSASDDWMPLLPLIFIGFLLLVASSSVASGGGRELVARDHAVAFPISPATDHFGALVMAPLNVAWLLQIWLVLGVTVYVAGPVGVVSGAPLVLVWAAFSTAVGQISGWTMEAVRRGPGGAWAARGLLAILGVVAGVLVATGTGQALVDALPTRFVIEAAVDPRPSWPLVFLFLLAATWAAVLAGVPAARLALRRPERDEQRLDATHYRARPIPTGGSDAWGDVRTLLRVDRAAVLRSVPMRRGLLVLTVLPGLGGLVSGLNWDFVILMPGLVGSGVALLFGVNGWALDGRGALWRESLPVRPQLVFAARTAVLTEMTLLAAVAATFLAGLRAGRPDAAVVSALLCGTVVIVLQIVATSARWSVRNPYAVDLRSARAVPAPPVVMLGYSARLALGTTCTGMVFSGLAQVDGWLASPIFAVPFLVWSGTRLLRARRAWCKPGTRAHVVSIVAA